MSAPSHRRRPGRPSGSDPLAVVSTRDLILSVAIRLYSLHGYERVTLGDISAAAGLTSASLYYHFRGKEDLFAEAMVALVQQLVERASRIYASTASYRERLEALANQLITVNADPRNVQVLLREAARHIPPERLRPVRLTQVAGTAAFERFLRQAMDDGALRRQDASMLAYSFIYLTHTVGITDGAGHHPVAPTSETAERLVDLFLQGTAAGTA